MTPPETLPDTYFDALYARDPDPWHFASSEYERDKYAATLRALPARRFASALEVGCSIGVLTRHLAERCDRLLAVDVAEAALAQARQRCADLPQVEIARRRLPQDWPSQDFDLILLSEVLYYLSPDDIDRMARQARASLQPGGSVLLVHYVLPTDYPCSGDAASERFMDTAGLRPVLRQRHPSYRLDLLRA